MAAELSSTSRFTGVEFVWGTERVQTVYAIDSDNKKHTFRYSARNGGWGTVTTGQLKILRDIYNSDDGLRDSDGDAIEIELRGCPYSTDADELEALGYIHPLKAGSHDAIVAKMRAAAGLPPWPDKATYDHAHHIVTETDGTRRWVESGAVNKVRFTLLAGLMQGRTPSASILTIQGQQDELGTYFIIPAYTSRFVLIAVKESDPDLLGIFPYGPPAGGNNFISNYTKSTSTLVVGDGDDAVTYKTYTEDSQGSESSPRKIYVT